MFRVAVFLVALFGLLSCSFGYIVTSDDTGKYLAAANQKTGVKVSSDFGATWVQTSQNGATWSGLTSDGTGKKLALSATCTSGGYCFAPVVTADQGATWTFSSGPFDNYYSIASDGSGNKLVSAGGNNIYVSYDAGATWGATSLKQGYSGTAVAYSADGSTFVQSYMNYISVHVNGTFQETPSLAARWNSLSTDATGKVIVGAYDTVYSGAQSKGIYLSTNTGSSYTPLVTNTGSTTYYCVYVTDDASLVFYGATGAMYQYNVAKKTTTLVNLPGATISSIAASKNGKYVVVSDGNYVYVSSDYGINYKNSDYPGANDKASA